MYPNISLIGRKKDTHYLNRAKIFLQMATLFIKSGILVSRGFPKETVGF